MLELDFSNDTPKYEGYVYNLEHKVYRQQEEFLSATDLKALLENPLKYFCKQEKEKTASMIEGSLLHCLLGEPERLYLDFEILNTESISKKQKEDYKDCEKDLITHKTLDRVSECANYIKNELKSRYGLDLDMMDSEVSYFGEYDYKGKKIKGKCRFDKLSKNRKISIDFKKTESALPENFVRQMAELNYPIQDYWYSALTGVQFIFLAIDTKPFFSRDLGKNIFQFSLIENDLYTKEKSKDFIDVALSRYINRDAFNSPVAPSINPKDDINENGEFEVKFIKQVSMPQYWNHKLTFEMRA